MKRHFTAFLFVVSVLGTAYAQVSATSFDSTAIAIEMDTTVTTDGQHADDTAAVSIDTAKANLLFKAIDKLLPSVRTSYIADSLYRLLCIDDELYGGIKKVTGTKNTVNFTLRNPFDMQYNMKRTYTFNQVFEYVLDDDLDVIIMVSDDGKASYIAYCSNRRLVNHLAYLMEFKDRECFIYELNSTDGADVAMFNYTLENVCIASGSTIYPIGDIEQAPKQQKEKTSPDWFTITMSSVGSVLATCLLVVLLLL